MKKFALMFLFCLGGLFGYSQSLDDVNDVIEDAISQLPYTGTELDRRYKGFPVGEDEVTVNIGIVKIRILRVACSGTQGDCVKAKLAAPGSDEPFEVVIPASGNVYRGKLSSIKDYQEGDNTIVEVRLF